MSSANLTRAEAEQRSANLEVHAYDVDLDLTGAADPERTGFGSVTTITFLSEQEDVRLDFLGESVEGVEVNGRALDPSQVWDGAALRLTGLAPHRTNRVTVRAVAAYSRTGQGLHRFVDPLDGETYLYSHLEPADARRIFATFEQPDLKATRIVHVTAPAGWSVVANMPVASAVPVGDEAVRTTFQPTPPLSTYLTAVCAGPWHHVHDVWTRRVGASTLEVPLGLWCRASLAQHLDADALFDTTKRGLDHYHQLFGFPYPWGKYDQLFAPEYNIGAMENPGCITFNEKYLFTSRPTRQELAQRSNTMLHEMAHLWFGDLVTPAWWDDLWLKESFAEYMGVRSSVEADDHPEAWVSFAGARKAWAYAADRRPTTHPVAADIPDLEAARQNFDGITYAKGAAVLKQLVAYVGDEAFFSGARLYFARHAFGAARLVDLLDALEEVSGRNLRAWAEQWLQTSGVDELTTEGPGPEGIIHLRRTSPDTARRPHRLSVGLYLPDSTGRLLRTHRAEADLVGDGVDIDLVDADPAGERPRLVLPNDDDLTYALTRLDPASRDTALTYAGGMVDPLAQSQVWAALWNDVRDARLPATRFIAAVLQHAGRLDGRDDEGATVLLPHLVGDVATGVSDLLPRCLREAAWADAFDGAWTRLVGADPGSDQQLAWARAATLFGGQVGAEDAPGVAARLGLLLDGPAPEGLEIGSELRWRTLIALAGLDRVDDAELDAALAAEPTARARAHRLTARVGRPDARVRAWAWEQVQRYPSEWSNEEISAALAGWTMPGHRDLVAEFAEPYWSRLTRWWERFPIEIATRLVSGLFPAVVDVDLTREAVDQPVVAAAHRWLDEHTGAPGALRRLVLEHADAAERAARAQLTVLEQVAAENG
ncbi:aminopeptidase N [Raineyella fluvialis]|uniref:Aminopeptidase N n=1 Tax=Raineyella fluvialis TaxID=2662261 RepID=A0A5Q2FDH5_9ACTN|nr:aminopeptidase N [Raineyella fluvialis]QGF23847.1 aminopeptidase N [Raineyella fluvialis]